MVAQILLIDDQTAILKRTSQVLNQLGHEVEVAREGEKRDSG
jgi:CheY-like chemotaxis protein